MWTTKVQSLPDKVPMLGSGLPMLGDDIENKL